MDTGDAAKLIQNDYLSCPDTNGILKRILRDAGVAQASIHIETHSSKPEQRISQRSILSGNEEEPHRTDAVYDGTLIHAVGSLTKLFVAILISVIVDTLSCSDEPENEPYRRLRKLHPDPWSTSFTKLFNSFSKIKMSPLRNNPTLRHVLLHFNSLPSMNSILLAPDGTSIMSVEDFLEVAPRLAQRKDSIEYSNGNYILIGLLIKAIAPQPETLQTLMKKYIFQPLRMNNTYMSGSDLDSVSSTRPHVVSTDGRPKLVDSPGYRADAIVNPAFAAYSCTKDMAILFRALIGSLNGDESNFKQDFVRNLLQPGGKLDEIEGTSQTLCGIYTTLDTSTPGCRSINRIIAPTDECSTYPLGVRFGNEALKVPTYYMTGAVHGYASCFYFIPAHNTFVIVLTNTSGRIDASDHISRFILQELFDLERSPRQVELLRRSQPDTSSDVVKAKVDIPEMSSRAALMGHNLLKEWERADTQEDMPGALTLQLDGTYTNEFIHQSIIIRPYYGRLIVNIKGGAGISRDIGLHRTGNFTFRLYPLHQDGFTIDRYEDRGWKDLGFNIKVKEDTDGSHKIIGIERHGNLLPSTIEYKRT